MFRKLKNGTPREKGQVIVLVALMLMAVLGLTAMAIDLSFVFVQRRDMQNAADAGALAGARLLALYSADPTMSVRYRDVYYATLEAAQGNGAGDITAYTVHCGDHALDRQLKPNDYAAVQRCPGGCGVWVKTDREFGTFLAGLFGVQQLQATAEAQAEFGLPKSVGGVAPIGLRDTVFEKGTHGVVGSTYTMWDSKKEGGSTRGWLGLDCLYPDKGSQCSPDANSLKHWMDPPYYEDKIPKDAFIGGDPGVKASVLDHANPPEILIIPIFDYVYHFTNYRYCNPDDPKYDWWKCRQNEVYEGTIPVYTSDSGYNGKYYYHITTFAAFEVKQVGQQGSDKFITGIFQPFVVASDWTSPGCLDYASGNHDSLGVVVVKLTK